MADEQLSVREKALRDRQARVAKMQSGAGRVRVLPRDDDVRRDIKHQPSLIGFPESGSVEWPDDAFTRRRIEDGSVTLEDQPKQQQSRGSAAAQG